MGRLSSRRSLLYLGMLAIVFATAVGSGLALAAMFLVGRTAVARRPLAVLAALLTGGLAAAAGALVLDGRRLAAVMATLTPLGGTGGPPVALTTDSITTPAVWPTPQQQNARADGFPLLTTVAVVRGTSTDPAAVSLVERVFRSAGVTRLIMVTDQQPAPAAPVIVWVGGPSENAASAGALQALGLAGPAGLDPEGYVLGIGRGSDHQAQVVLAGADATGTFYAAQTLRQLIVAHLGRRWLPGVSIRDWPGTRLRGVIEGFYGPPWSAADRLSQLDFFASTKQNLYVYAPKNDPFLRAQWRQPYPPDRLALITQLVERAAADHVQFTYALSPGLSVCYSSDSDEQALVAKLQSMWDIGVRSFAIAFDDISYTRWNCRQDGARFGTGGSAAGQAQADLVNRVQHDFIDTHLAAHRLAMVPTEFSGVTDSPYRAAIRTHLDPRVIVEWTGMEVVPATVTAPQAEQAKRVFGHDVLLWDNYPVNDYAPNRLFLGPYMGRDRGIGDHLAGVTVNPMIESEPSKIAEFTSGAFLWNPAGYQAPDAWLAGLHVLGGPAWQALRVFAENNYSSILTPAESPTLTPFIREFWRAYESRSGIADTAAALLSYFSDMAAAPGRLRTAIDDSAFLSEAQPWIEKLGMYGRAGQAAVAMLVAQTGDEATAEKASLALASVRDQLAATPQIVAPGVVDAFIWQAVGASGR